MSQKKSGSKRLSLRFNAADLDFRYKTEFEDGKGTLINISSGGCAVQGLDVPLAPDEKVLVILKIDEEQIEIGARVLRVEKDVTALAFVQVSDENCRKIVSFFAARQRLG